MRLSDGYYSAGSAGLHDQSPALQARLVQVPATDGNNDFARPLAPALILITNSSSPSVLVP